MAEIVVVGVDGSETALRAAQRAADVAAATRARLHVVTAFSHYDVTVVGVGDDTWVIDTLQEALNTAERVAATLRRPDLEVTCGAGEGKPHDVLIEEAAAVKATLLVVGNRRMQGVARVLGSIANSVAHHAPCDVLIVKTT
jgi:nucleotide-binding universal stress UspA family protein